MSKSISKMNKKELYELCKTLQDDLHKEKLFNDEIVELQHKMLTTVSEYIHSCEKCQNNKIDRQRPQGLLQPVQVHVEPGRSYTLLKQIDGFRDSTLKYTKTDTYLPL